MRTQPAKYASSSTRVLPPPEKSSGEATVAAITQGKETFKVQTYFNTIHRKSAKEVAIYNFEFYFLKL